MDILNKIKESLAVLSIPGKAAFFYKFFKAGKGGYGEGDLFLGVTVPDQRAVAKEYYQLISLSKLSKLLHSKYHEHRLTSLLILILKFEKSKSDLDRKEIVDFYLSHLDFINNWDLVDSSCYKILGRYAFENNKPELLRNLALEDNLWLKRIAIVGTIYYLRNEVYDFTKEFVLLNLNYPHDLLHKANGWLLREMGKKNETELVSFLNLHYQKMPRTCLRYAIERLDQDVKEDYMKGRI